MYRNIIEQLKEWKNKEGRKPLILSGARQVGKTYILKRFGEQEFANVAYINCDDNELAKNLFMQDYNIQRIILAIGAITEQSIEALSISTLRAEVYMPDWAFMIRCSLFQAMLLPSVQVWQLQWQPYCWLLVLKANVLHCLTHV